MEMEQKALVNVLEVLAHADSMSITIEDNGAPDADVGGDVNENNPDTFEPTDNELSDQIQK